MPRSNKGGDFLQPKALDVIAPGKSIPSSSARPIIVTNRPMIKDPMAPAERALPERVEESSTTSGATTLLSPPEAPSIRPTDTETVMPPKDQAVKSNIARPAAESKETVADSISATEDMPTEPDAHSLAKDVTISQTPDAAAKDNEAIQQEKLIVGKQYYLPIRNIGTQRSARRSLVLLLIVLIVSLIWLDLVMDAGIVRLGVHPLTHFFNTNP